MTAQQQPLGFITQPGAHASAPLPAGPHDTYVGAKRPNVINDQEEQS